MERKRGCEGVFVNFAVTFFPVVDCKGNKNEKA